MTTFGAAELPLTGNEVRRFLSASFKTEAAMIADVNIVEGQVISCPSGLYIAMPEATYPANTDTVIDLDAPTLQAVRLSLQPLTDRAALLADTRGADWFETGQTIRAQDYSYEVAATGAADQHETTSGGAKLYETGHRFTTLQRFKDAVARGVDYRAGDTVLAEGSIYEFLDDGNTGIAGLTGWGVSYSASMETRLTAAEGDIDALERHQYTTRAAFLAAVASGVNFQNGATVMADGVAYVFLDDGNTDIPNLTGWTASDTFRPAHFGYSDTASLTIGPSDPWQEVIEAYQGTGTITLEDGTYAADGYLRPRARRLQLLSETHLGARLVASIIPKPGSHITFDGLDMAPPNTMRLIDGENMRVDLREVTIDCSDAGVTSSRIFELTNSELYLTADTEDCVIRVGPNTRLGTFKDTHVQAFGNTGVGRVKVYSDPGADINKVEISLAPGSLVADGMEAIGQGTKGGIAINGIRGSRVIMQGSSSGNNLFQNLRRGISLSQASKAHIAATTFDGNTAATWRGSGSSIWLESDTVSLTSNDFDHTNEALTDGNEPVPLYYHPQVLIFTSGSDTIPAGSTRYIGPSGAFTSEGSARIQAPFDGTIRNLRVQANGGPGTSESIAVTVRQGNSDTPITVVLTDGTYSDSDLTNTHDVTAGQTLCISAVASGGASARTVSASFEIVAT